MTIPILTSSWRTLIDDTQFVRVGVSRSTPRGPKGFRRFTSLEPGSWFKTVADPVEWAARYDAEMLSRLDPVRVVADLRAMSDGAKAIVLLCWEPSDGSEWCHRSLISVWLKDRVGLDVSELGDQACRCGLEHPLLPGVLRRR